MNGQEPAITRTDPRAYYLYLQAQGMNPTQAVQAVEQRFGPPKSADDRAREQAGNAQTNALYQTGGVIAGAIGSKLIYDKVAGWIDPATGAKATPEVVNNLTQTVPVSQTAGASGLPNVNTEFNYQTPDFQYGNQVTIDTPIGPQQVPAEIANDPGFLSQVDWNRVGQGGLGVLQLYGAYKAYQGGDKIGAGLSGATGAANIATAAGADLGANLVPGLNIATGAYTGYRTAEALGDMAAGSKRTQTGVIGGATAGASMGAGIGAFLGPKGAGIGAAIGAVVGGISGAVGSWTGSSKGKAQFMRDNIRGVLQEGGILDDKFQGTLADGTKYDFGKDGSTLKWKNIDKIVEKQPAAWNAAVPLTDAIAAAYGFVGQKASDISAWYAKGAVSNAGDDASIAIKNAQHFAQQQGLTFDMIKARLDEAMKDERINQSQYDYYLNGARQVTAGVKPQQGPPQGPQGAPPPQAPPAQQPPPQQGNMSIRQLLQQNMQKQ
jgi:hypothetical protein